jgi:ferredoxin
VTRGEGMRLRVNPIACTGHGLCAELLPEVVGLDPWGYPLIADGPVPRHLAEHARRAAAACPTLALLIEDGSLVEAGRRRGGRHAG